MNQEPKELFEQLRKRVAAFIESQKAGEKETLISFINEQSQNELSVTRPTSWEGPIDVLQINITHPSWRFTLSAKGKDELAMAKELLEKIEIQTKNQ